MKAKRLLQKALEQNANDVYLLTQMANVLWNLSKDEMALTYADKAQMEDSDYPLMLFTRGRILWSLEQYRASVTMWDKLLSANLADIAEKGWSDGWARTVVNDARYYKADCLYCLYQTKEAIELMQDHIANRRKGQQSDFTIKEAGAWSVTGGFGMAKGFGATSKLGKLAGKLGYQMIGTTSMSIGNNWASNKEIFSKLTLGVGPVNLTIGKGQKLLQWENNIGNILSNSFGLINTAFGGKAQFDIDNLTFVYKGGLRENSPAPFFRGGLTGTLP